MANSQSQIVPIIRLGLARPGLLRLAVWVKRSQRTFLSYSKLFSLVESYFQVRKKAAAPPRIAEFGVGRGGSAMILAWLIRRYGGSLALFDVFDRIPPPSEVDGDQAQKRYQTILSKESDSYYGNVSNLLEIVQGELGAICPLEQMEFIQGRYEDTLPGLSKPHSFDLVHIDCDWYESAKTVLDYLEKNLQPGAILQIDDYLFWQGARKAIDEAAWLQSYSRRTVADALVIDTGQHL